jgi:cardiolipin synthase
MFGSPNWDARSLRLNFELGVESYSEDLGARMSALLRDRMSLARPLTLATLDARPFPVKLRDGIARLAAPHL